MSFSLENPIRVGLAGLGFMGQMHLGCYRANPLARVVAVADNDTAKLSGQSAIAGNIAGNEPLDLTGLQTTSRLQDLIENPELDLLDFCLPTSLHAAATIAALEAGKHVLCEKPMAFTVEECDQIIAAQEKSGRFLLIGHCLRFWPQYVKAGEILGSGELGKPVYANFHRSSGAPIWSDWLMNGAQSGGVLLDMHVHDIDTALWWFGTPQTVAATGLIGDGLPLKADATWTYENGPLVQIHGGWDRNTAPFRMAFEVLCEGGTLCWDSSRGEAMEIRRGKDVKNLDFHGTMGYAPEINYFLDCIAQNQTPTRATPRSSREAVQIAREELRQIGFLS